MDLENLTGLSRASVDRHVGGDKEPNIDQRALYARAFKMTPEDFEDAWQEMADGEPICFTPAPAEHAQLLQLAEADEKSPADMVNELVAEALKRRAEIAGSINPHVPLNGKPWGRSHAAKRPAPKGNGKRKN